jgi:hypothetical protein
VGSQTIIRRCIYSESQTLSTGSRCPGVISKHHDCLSANEERVLTDSPQQPGAVKVSTIIREAKDGRRGGELLEFITGDHKKADLAQGVQE